MKDQLNLALPEDLLKCRQQALKLRKHGSLEGLHPVRLDSRTVVFKKKKPVG